MNSEKYLNLKGNKIVLVRDPSVNLKIFSTPVFYFSHQSAASVANSYLGLNQDYTIK